MKPRILLAGFAFFVPSVMGGSVFAQTTCPSSCIRFVSQPEVCSSRTAVDSTYYVCDNFDCGEGHAQYDLVAGQVGARAIGWNGGGFSAGARAVDDYRVVGLSDGQPLTFEARLEVDGYNVRIPQEMPSGGGSFTVEIREGVANAQSITRGDGTWNLTLTIPIATNAGTWFRIACTIGADGFSGSGRANGRLSFSGLPQGAAVVSCQGYRYDVPVPAVPASWGRVKGRYR